jgi:Polyketide cyclase / dehydrase and lipid transport
MTIQFCEYDRPHRLAERVHMKAMDLTGVLTFEPIDGGTRMRWSWDLEPHGVLRFMGPVVARMGSGRSGGSGRASSSFWKRRLSSRRRWPSSLRSSIVTVEDRISCLRESTVTGGARSWRGADAARGPRKERSGSTPRFLPGASAGTRRKGRKLSRAFLQVGAAYRLEV